jgi:ABC-type polysaccharide/polyol phosphate transport system ATPase subunit
MSANGEPAMLPPGAIHVEDLVLEYPVYRHLALDRCRALLGAVLPWLSPPFHRVLDRVTLAIKPGEVVGIVGLNGAGKTSLLKVIAGLLSPTEGTVRVGGRVMALLAMGVGFRPALTGRQNLLIGGLLLGLETRDITERMQEIAEFSELGEALDQPYFTYSSGMRARLAFSLATIVPADIVILDETLATGDARFVTKCYRRLKEIRDSGKTILFVSHNLGEVARVTSRVLLIDRSRVAFDGDVFEGLRAYERMLVDSMNAIELGDRSLGGVVPALSFHDEHGEQIMSVRIGQRISISLRVTVDREIGQKFVIVRILDLDRGRICAYLTPQRWQIINRETVDDSNNICFCEGNTIVTWNIPCWMLGEGVYSFDVYLGPPTNMATLDMSKGRFWNAVARLPVLLGNSYMRGAGTVIEMPVDSVQISHNVQTHQPARFGD